MSELMLFLRNEFMPSKRQKRNLIVYLDAIKILAAFFVVFYHFAYYKLDYGFFAGVNYTPNIARVCMSFGACSVPLFFMVNGALMFNKERTIKGVYFKALKLLFLVMIWSFTKFPSWFFKTMVILYLLFPVLQWLKQKHKQYLFLICIAVFVFPFLYNFLISLIKAKSIEFVMGISISNLHITGAATMYALLYFIVGSILFELKKKISVYFGILSSMIGISMTVIECMIYTNINQEIYDGVNHAFPTIGALLLSIGVWIIFENCSFSKFTNVITFLGGGVLPIYVMHSTIIRVITKVFCIDSLQLIPSIIYTIGICLLCICAGKVLEKVPILCCLVRI